MFGTGIFDVGIGLILVYLILGFVCTSVNEYIAQILSLRAENLWVAIKGLFQNSKQAEDFAQRIYDHDLVDSLSRENSKPSYIPAHVFSLALSDTLGITGKAAAAGAPFDTVSNMLESADVDETIKKTLRPLADAAGNDIDQFRRNVETWFDAAMERASGWYKKRVQTIIFWVAMSAALITNADTLMLADTLWKNPSARAAMAAAGTKLASPPGAETTTLPDKSNPAFQEAQSQVTKLIGWSGTWNWNSPNYNRNDVNRFPEGWEWLPKLLGILITAFAASLGAPFWFDILNKVVRIRSSGTAPGEKQRNPAETPKPQDRISSAAAATSTGAAAGSTTEASSGQQEKK